MYVGRIEITPILDGTGSEPLDRVVTPSNRWDCPSHPVDIEGRIKFDFGAHLIHAGGRRILVDAGLGPYDSNRWTGGALLANLRALGIMPGDITDVVFTHLHSDHVGWATQEDKVVFDHATHYVHQADWAYFVESAHASPDLVRKLSPMAAQLDVFDDETAITPGVMARPAPGHTPGSSIVVVASSGDRALILGDVAHAVGELTDPELESLYDLDRRAGRLVRNAIAEEAAEAADAVAAAHFPGLRFGRLVRSDHRRSFEFI